MTSHTTDQTGQPDPQTHIPLTSPAAAPMTPGRRLILAGAIAVALISTAAAYVAMVGFGHDVVGMTTGLAYSFAGVFELSLVTVALMAREAAQQDRPARTLLTLTWMLSAASGTFAAVHELYIGHPVIASAFRFSVPLLAALMWHLALVGDRHLAMRHSWSELRAGGRLHRMFFSRVAWRRALAADDGTWRSRRKIAKANARRIRAEAVAMRTVHPTDMNNALAAWDTAFGGVANSRTVADRFVDDDLASITAVVTGVRQTAPLKALGTSDHTTDHARAITDHPSDHPSDHGPVSAHESSTVSAHDERSTDHKAAITAHHSAHHTDHQGDHRGDHAADHDSDHSTDQGAQGERSGAHQSAHQPDHQGDHERSQAVITVSDHAGALTDHTSDHGTDQAIAEPITTSDRPSDHPSDRVSAHGDRVSAHDRGEVITGVIGDRSVSAHAHDHEVAPAAETAVVSVPAGPERDAVIDRMLSADASVTGAQVAAALGVSEPTGRRELKRARDRAARELDMWQVYTMREAGQDWETIGEAVGAPAETVRRAYRSVSDAPETPAAGLRLVDLQDGGA